MNAVVIPFPAKLGTPQAWVAANPNVFFIAEEATARRCWWCRKQISPGSRYFGAYALRLKFDGDERLRDWRVTTKVEMRLHPACSRELGN